MKIKTLYADGFRCLSECHIDFDDQVTIIVGENDCGKTSLIDCLKIVTQGKPVEIDDFNYDKKRIEIRIDIENMLFTKIYKLEDEKINEEPLKARMNFSYIDALRKKLNEESFDLADKANDKEIRDLGRLLGVTVRANISTEKIRERINEMLTPVGPEGLGIENAQFPPFNNILLDGRQFENVSSFFKEIFLKEKQTSIWHEPIDSGISIEEFVRNKVDSYSSEISQKMAERGMVERIRKFLPSLTDIKIEPVYQTKDLNIDAKVKFLEGSNEVNLQKKGDGTKRRITMALLEFKRDENIVPSDGTTIYLLDEPDTHLHVRAQMQLLNTLKEFCASGNQVIITTHSPFLMNAIRPSEIRMMYQKEPNKTRVKCLTDQKDITSKILQNIGVENLYLFFARTLIIVEGETEESFIPNYHYRIFGEGLSSRLIRLINVRGIQNIFGFSKGILELHSSEHILALYDNDASPETKSLIDSLAIKEENKFILGRKEFEDTFSSDAIYRSWKKHLESIGKTVPANWTKENIELKKAETISDPAIKFSAKIRELNAGSGTQMTKPVLGSALAEHILPEELPEALNRLLQKVRSCS